MRRHGEAAADLKPDLPVIALMAREDSSDRCTRRDMARICKRRVGKTLSAHSSRVGGAIDQHADAIIKGQITRAGDWKGDAMPARYTREVRAMESGAAILARRRGRA